MDDGKPGGSCTSFPNPSQDIPNPGPDGVTGRDGDTDAYCRSATHGEHGTIKSAWNPAVAGCGLDEDCALLSLSVLDRQALPQSSGVQPQHCLSWAGSRPKPHLGQWVPWQSLAASDTTE